MNLEATRASVSPLFQAINQRQCTRGDYDGTLVSANELRLLERAGTGNGVRVMLLTERAATERVLEYVVAANTTQMSDPAFVAELKTWIRFGADEALRTRDGLFAGTTGNPTMPRWLGSRAMGLFFTPKSENERYGKSAIRPALPCSLQKQATSSTGSRWDAATSASRCRPPRSACATPC